ncbi:glycoside hydrolase [Delitschia confertaspora ATCC 74209]|uniref:Glycoside hydrolase n=1 Tax=Delitschia confertaspora ATCC 74209 TaxID=1513339 RepID=A0A9P4JLU8_9PLEO|nr:glycoside hydrolase [Delitschia confertaspora ATCC 74209]
MLTPILSILLPSLLTLTPLVSAHGRIVNITTSSGNTYSGFDPAVFLKNPSSPPPLAAWSADNLGNIFVPPSSFSHSNITCHRAGTPGALHIPTPPGSNLTLTWNEWPTSHKGPVLTYLASCNASCTSVSKDALRWVKIDEQGWLNSSGWTELGGTWASDVLIKNGFSWTVKVPEELEAGAYVLRHEIIALHVANETDGAQAYPQCVNLMMGNKRIDGGVDARKFYKENDKGIMVDIHHKLDGYAIPGPKLWTAAEPVEQPNEAEK